MVCGGGTEGGGRDRAGDVTRWRTVFPILIPISLIFVLISIDFYIKFPVHANHMQRVTKSHRKTNSPSMEQCLSQPISAGLISYLSALTSRQALQVLPRRISRQFGNSERWCRVERNRWRAQTAAERRWEIQRASWPETAAETGIRHGRET